MPYRVLVVENDGGGVFELCSIIEDAGHELVGRATCCEQAVEMAQVVCPGIALVSMELSGSDGIETARQLIDQGVAAVILTARQAGKESIEAAASVGAYTFLLDPVDPSSLLANIELTGARSSEFALLKKENEDAKAALETRKLTERAKHILMSRLSLSEDDAFSHLRHKCRNQNKTMRQVADEVIAADNTFLDAVEKEPPKRGL